MQHDNRDAAIEIKHIIVAKKLNCPRLIKEQSDQQQIISVMKDIKKILKGSIVGGGIELVCFHGDDSPR